MAVKNEKNNVIIDLGDRKIQLPRISGTVGPDVVDIRKLYNDTNLFTFDPGFTSTASCESAITYIAVSYTHLTLPTIYSV